MNFKISKQLLLCLWVCLPICATYGQKTEKRTTSVSIEIPSDPVLIDPMIYGQMLEDCNDKVIYGGLLNDKNEENPAVYELLKPLAMPVVRWPAGTYIHEYDWKNGVGPKDKRPMIACVHWGGHDSNLFGTDEFLQWCQKIGTQPYLNFNMSNHPDYAGSLGDALNWIEYVNGSTETAFGMKRAANGHPEPYKVKYWGVGNENYGNFGVHKAETVDFYTNKLYQWASSIKFLYPDLSLLAVGHSLDWNEKVLKKNGKLIDYLTLHFYMGAKIKDSRIENPAYTLFSPLKTEMEIHHNVMLFDRINRELGRADNPIRISIDEWNCRHTVFEGGKYTFTRNDDRRLFDVAATAGMLNVFIRQSPHVGMANYIFPVNGHGLIRSVGDDDAYQSTIYPVFELYRKYMIGKRIDIRIKGANTTLPVNKLTMGGTLDDTLLPEDITVTYVDGAAVLTDDHTINIALINRSHDLSQKIKVDIPDGFIPSEKWTLENRDINAGNTAADRTNIEVKVSRLSKKDIEIVIPPCGFTLVQYKKLYSLK